jgi:6-phosphogluconolactonase
MPTATPVIRIVDSPESLVSEAAKEFVRLARESALVEGEFSVTLAGGSTPRRLYELLANQDRFYGAVSWGQIHFFWGDERHVPPNHAESNYRMAYESMLSKVPVSQRQVHRIAAESPDASHAARAYEETIVQHFGLAEGRWPRFDLVLLGLGSDAHTASLFPGTDVLTEQKRIVAAPWVEKLKAFRITLTPSVFNAAENVMFLVSGEDKAVAVEAVLRGQLQPQQFPAQLIRPHDGTLTWLIDRAAAQRLGEQE